MRTGGACASFVCRSTCRCCSAPSLRIIYGFRENSDAETISRKRHNKDGVMLLLLQIVAFEDKVHPQDAYHQHTLAALKNLANELISWLGGV